jgi:hypothetical protein
MGKGILNAVAAVFPDTPDYICHFHFLRDIGRIAGIIQQGAFHSLEFEPISDIIVYMLVQWIFEYPSQSSGYGFPFDRPHLDFYRRLQEVYEILGKFKDAGMDKKAKRPVIQIYKVIAEFAEDQRLNDLAKDLEVKSAVFDKLREAMRIALPDGKDGINDNGGCSDMKTIEERVTVFRKWLPFNKHRKKTYAGMMTQIDKYWEKLFADPIAIQSPQGTVTVQPQRTNNILERFSQIDARLVQQEMNSSTQNKDKILSAIKKMIKDVKFTEKISKLFCPC